MRNANQFCRILYGFSEDDLCIKKETAAIVEFHKESFKFPLTPSPLIPEKEAPCNRYKHAVCLSGSKIYVLGGIANKQPLNDLWIYVIVDGCWKRVDTYGDKLPQHLELHTMISYDDKLYIFGGVSRLPDDMDCPLWIYDTCTHYIKQWKCDHGVKPPCLRGHSCVMHKGFMYLFGGYNDLAEASNVLWKFDMRERKWENLNVVIVKKSVPPPRHSHTATLHGNVMIVYGGVKGFTIYNDVWVWHFGLHTWSKLKTSSTTPKLFGHSAVKVAESMYIIGGRTQTGKLSPENWQYDLGSKTIKMKKMVRNDMPKALCYSASALLPLSQAIPYCKLKSVSMSEIACGLSKPSVLRKERSSKVASQMCRADDYFASNMTICYFEESFDSLYPLLPKKSLSVNSVVPQQFYNMLDNLAYVESLSSVTSCSLERSKNESTEYHSQSRCLVRSERREVTQLPGSIVLAEAEPSYKIRQVNINDYESPGCNVEDKILDYNNTQNTKEGKIDGAAIHELFIFGGQETNRSHGERSLLNIHRIKICS